MRLIDAEALIDEINEMWKIHPAGLENRKILSFEAVIDLIGAAPVIEAKPVVRAHWKEWYPPKEFILTGEERLYICSNCDAKYSNVENNRFCSWCGAQMDEVASDNNVGGKTENDERIREEAERIRREREGEERKYD